MARERPRTWHLSCPKQHPKRRKETTSGEDGDVEGAPLPHSPSRSVHDPWCHRLYASRRRSRGTVPPIDGLTISYLPVFETRPLFCAYLAAPSLRSTCFWRLGALLDVMGVLVRMMWAVTLRMAVMPAALQMSSRHLLARARPVIIWSMEAFPKNEVVIPPRHPARQQSPPPRYPPTQTSPDSCAVKSTAHTSTTGDTAGAGPTMLDAARNRL